MVPPIVHDVLRTYGEPIDPATRSRAESHFGRDFSHVRIHTDAQAAASARAIDAVAYTVGEHIAFREGKYRPNVDKGRQLLDHELTHVVQQAHSPLSLSSLDQLTLDSAQSHAEVEAQAVAAEAPESRARSAESLRGHSTVQRYKSYEHGEAAAVESFIAKDEHTYVVKRDDAPAAIAKAFGVTIAALLERNKKKVRVWAGAGGREVEGFDAGDAIVIPSEKLILSPPPSPTSAVSKAQKKVTVHGVSMDYGEAMAMADYYKSFDDFEKADPSEINALLILIRKEGKSTPVGEAEWDKATLGRYMDLNRANIGHFAPPDPALIAGKASATGVNHKTEWEKYHKQAVEESVKGNRDRALAANAFGDHFLTDAFAAGHLFNKEDVMAQVTASLASTTTVESFATNVAEAVFADPVAKALCSKYESKKTRFRWAINSPSRFAELLKGINASMPDLLPNAVAASVHDQLNSTGVTVTNAHKDAWTVKGDGSLEPMGLYIMREAVAQSQINVLNAARSKTVDMAALYKAVWDFTPTPDAGGKKAIASAIQNLADPNKPTTVGGVADVVKANLRLIMDKIVDHGDLYPPK